MAKPLVKLWERPSYDGKRFRYYLLYTDRRTLPLTDMLTQLLVDHQNRQPEGHPYVFVPPVRYDYIQNNSQY